jgi:hypothetical protein
MGKPLLYRLADSTKDQIGQAIILAVLLGVDLTVPASPCPGRQLPNSSASTNSKKQQAWSNGHLQATHPWPHGAGDR